MKFPRHLIRELVPDGLPPERFLKGEVTDLADSVKDGLLRRSYLWSIALMNASFDQRFKWPPGLISYSTGFVHITEENAYEHREWIRCIEGFSYGANMLIEPGELLRQIVTPLKIDDFKFPVVVNFGFFEETGLPTHPGMGTGTCWIENQKQSGGWRKGILTCRHTMNNIPLGSIVNLSASANYSRPSQGFLADITSCMIDAAIIGINEAEWPNNLSHLPICNPIAPGQSVSFQGRLTRGTGSVLRVFQHASYSNLLAQRIFTDCFGVKGDSGSLFVDPDAAGESGLGIHVGSIPDGSGNREGVCQHLFQASRFFGFSTFK